MNFKINDDPAEKTLDQIRPAVIRCLFLFRPAIQATRALLDNLLIPQHLLQHIAAHTQMRRNRRPSRTPPCLSPRVKDSEPGQQMHMPFARVQTGSRWTIISGNSQKSWSW